jgi:hypothetical protein
MNSWLRDLRYALRSLRKNPVPTVVILLSLAIGIGANTAIFSVVDALLLRPLPYSESERLAAIGIAAGLIGARALTRMMQALLFGVSATDSATFIAVAILLGLVAFAATVIPARRAAIVDPMAALREE